MAEGVPVAFLSYSREDSHFALRLAEDLKAAGASVWLDQLDIVPGQRWDRAVENALANCVRLLVVLSPAAVNSTNVMDEVSFALEEDKTVIPIISKDCAVPLRLRRVQYVDFRHDYARGLNELLKTLAPEQRGIPRTPASSNVANRGQTDVTELTERERAAEEERRKAAEEHKQAEEELGEQEQKIVAEQGLVEQRHERAAERTRLEQDRQQAAERVLFEDVHQQGSEDAGPRGRETVTSRWAGRKIAFAVCGALVVASFLFGWLFIRSGSGEPKRAQGEPSNTWSTLPKLGWAVGNRGTILHTEDGGNSWRSQYSGTAANLRSVTFATPMSGWAVGADGVILHTEDGGATWTTQTSGTKKELNSVVFHSLTHPLPSSLSSDVVNPQLGWAVGIDTVLHTEDGGSTWKRQFARVDDNLESVFFETPESGWAAGYSIYHTSDAGQTWEVQIKANVLLTFVVFTTPQSGWALGGLGTILHTEDGGSTWRAVDSGNSWKARTASEGSFLESLVFVTSHRAWIVGVGGTILHTEDGGSTWTTQTSGTDNNLSSVVFSTPLLGWAVGEKGTILHTEDGGNTWVPQTSGTNERLISVVFSNR